MLTVVMYHYVRRLAESRYPDIKGLERDAFVEQLRYIRRFYTPVSCEDVIGALEKKEDLPHNAILLTFDDGYLDHFTTVFPLLLREKIAGAFFPPARVLAEGRVLDVNKIHYILAAVKEKGELVEEIEKAIVGAGNSYELESLEKYRSQYAIASRFDTAEVIYFKRMLQVALPVELRKQITNSLFARYVSSDERAFAHELYMDEDQLSRSGDDGGLSWIQSRLA